MRKIPNLSRGMGIGGWLTNYKRFNVLPLDRRLCLTIGDFEHFDSYISIRDVENIRNMGFDHIRLGFDQIVLEESPYVYRERIFCLLERFVHDCKTCGIRPVLNLHKAVGNYCDIPEKVGLLDDVDLQNRFVALWEAVEKRLAGCPDVAFEILNEVRDVNPELWNCLADRTVRSIHSLNPNRLIIVGGIRWNNPDGIPYMKVWEDENIVYTFHNYAPFEFTHQRGVLQETPLFYNRAMEWPGNIEKYRDFHRVCFGNENAYPGREIMDREYLRETLAPAFDFIEKYPDKVLWCGEFGTIRHCALTYRINWFRDMTDLLKEYDIPYCVWNYLSTPNDGNRFSLVDDDTREILSPELLNALLGK